MRTDEIKHITFTTLICFTWFVIFPQQVTAVPFTDDSAIRNSTPQKNGETPSSASGGIQLESGTKKTRKKFPTWVLIGAGVLVVTGTIILLSGKKKSDPPIQPEPEPKQYGTIRVESVPSGASVYLDGNDSGQSTPSTLEKVTVGEHKLRLTLKGYEDFETSLTVEENETVNVNAELIIHIEMKLLPGGTFIMGSDSVESYPNERPRHNVTLKPFYIGKYEVTQGQWQAVMGDNPSYFQNGPDYPVESVSWTQVQEFIQKLNRITGKRFRLPTEAEWEYACRGNTGGDRYGALDNIGWYEANSGATSHPVGQKKPNGFGLYDTLGNVWEWCQDWFQPGYYSVSPKNDPQGPSSGTFHVLRGGSWFCIARDCRAPFRSWNYPNYFINILGFRLASDSE